MHTHSLRSFHYSAISYPFEESCHLGRWILRFWRECNCILTSEQSWISQNHHYGVTGKLMFQHSNHSLPGWESVVQALANDTFSERWFLSSRQGVEYPQILWSIFMITWFPEVSHLIGVVQSMNSCLKLSLFFVSTRLSVLLYLLFCTYKYLFIFLPFSTPHYVLPHFPSRFTPCLFLHEKKVHDSKW